MEITCFRPEKPFEFRRRPFFFLLRSPKIVRKNASISFKTNENLGQVHLRLYQTSKKAPPPPLQNPGYAPVCPL